MEDGLKDRVRKVRLYFGLSQAAFAKKINKTPGLISLVETGRCGLSEESLNNIADTFNVSREWLENGEGDMIPAQCQDGVDGVDGVDSDGIGKRIRELRTKLHLTESDFASGIPCSRMQISNIENGNVVPTKRFLQKVANAYFVSYDWLVTGKENSGFETPEEEADRIREFMLKDSVAREVVLESMTKDRKVWLEIYKYILNDKGTFMCEKK